MNNQFFKYQGTGNDFVMIDNRQKDIDLKNSKFIQHLCDRKFGVGGDGLIVLENDLTSNFKMIYFNADGRESTMCGNGGRCIVHFAKHLGIIDNEAYFSAIDGFHRAKIIDEKIHLNMHNVSDINYNKDSIFLNTGSPHHVEICTNLDHLDVKDLGAQIRYGKLYGELGANINFVEKINSSTFKVRTYERGVEDETLSCGTGVTAVAIAMYDKKMTSNTKLKILTLGGELQVSFNVDKGIYNDIWLIGPAVQVYNGFIKW
ncbi:diaminopimelate epimerase [Flavobacteriaceae bacterium]|jgi:diaminopimelate epimerase|nr:diaminopimelate epimerase [Flavobacteriaceae bacterium]